MVNVSMNSDDYNTANYFDEGVHRVTVVGATLDQLDDGREYVEVGVKGESGEEASVRLFLSTDKAVKFHLRTLQAICVHNAKTEAEKDKVRNGFLGQIDDAKLRKILDKLAGYEAWLTVYKSDRPYTNAQGETKYGYDRNLFGYEPAPKAPSKEDQINDPLRAGTPVTDDDEIPFV